MLSTPFCSHIIHYEPPRGFLVPKFSTYDGTNDPFDHIMHYRQLMTLDIGNDALLCKVFPASLQGQAFSWFHRLPPNSVGNFRDLSEAFHPVEHKNARQRILEGICETVWPSRTSGRGLQHGCYPTDLQAKHLSRHSIFESLAKKPPTTMDDLFRRANKYSMLEDDVRAATQQVLVARRPSRGDAERNTKPSDRPRPSDRRQEGPSLSDFRWPRPQGTDPSTRDHNKICAFYKDHGHTTETCRCLHFLVEKLIKAGHLKQYLCSGAGERDVPQNRNSGAPRAPTAPKAVISYINGGPSDEEYDSRRKRQKLLRAASTRERINSIRPGLTGGGPRPIDGTIIFPPVDPTRTLQPHRDALILSLEIGDFDVRRILIDPGSSADLVQASVETLYCRSKQAQLLSTYNSRCFLTNDGQIDLYGSQLAARQCYQIAREAGANQEDASPP
uniref:Retrotransposon gag domain-containing protein n=1 Tax=Vitis vinifera TaxID=29760 RepID=A5C1Q9_VITVI|nr:hypothetical protein VITISV_037963 [Vitis vinifera]